MNKSKLSPEEMRRLFPNASASTFRANGVQKETPAARVSEVQSVAMHEMILNGVRPTTDEAKLNELEKRYLAWLENLRPTWLGVQCITLKLGHDCRYTPDFWALDGQGLRAMDTKGEHTWEDSLIKIRVAARMFPFVRFLLVKQNGLVWDHKEVKP